MNNLECLLEELSKLVKRQRAIDPSNGYLYPLEERYTALVCDLSTLIIKYSNHGTNK